MAILPLTKQGLLVEHLAVHRSLTGNRQASGDFLAATTIEEKYKVLGEALRGAGYDLYAQGLLQAVTPSTPITYARSN
eukprot:2297239-Amphidinium_carterae.1